MQTAFYYALFVGVLILSIFICKNKNKETKPTNKSDDDDYFPWMPY